MKKTIITIIVTAVICITGTSYAAYKLKAEQVSFDKTNTDLNSNDVQSVLDEIATDILSYGDATENDILEGKTALVNGKKLIGIAAADGYKLLYIGEYNNYTISTYNCTNIPNYNNLTTNDFKFIMTGFKYNIVDNIYPQHGQEWNLDSKLSYNATSGILTVSYVGIGAENTSITIYGDIYAYIKL